MPEKRFLPDLSDQTARRRMLVKIGIALSIVPLLAAAGFGLTSTNEFCRLCHDMHADTDALAKSAHARLSCISCHQKPSVVDLVAHKFASISHLVKHVTGEYEKPINSESAIAREARIEDVNCDSCHSVMTRRLTPSNGLRMNHRFHLEIGVRCVFCHNRVAHPINGVGYADFMSMQGCARCHKRDTRLPGLGECRICHPKPFQLAPGEHATDSWRSRGHGDVALADRKPASKRVALAGRARECRQQNYNR